MPSIPEDGPSAARKPVLLPVVEFYTERYSNFETSGAAYESLRVGLSHASKIIEKLVWVAEL